MEVDWQILAQIVASRVAAVTGWFGVRRFRAVVKAQGAPREARIIKGAKPSDLPVEQPTKLARDQPENRQGARPRDSATASAARG